MPRTPEAFEKYLAKKAEILYDALVAWGEPYSGEPGEVLAEIALLTGIPYKTASKALLRLEQDERVSITRQRHPEPKQSNRIVRIEVL